jgi:uncharacterized cofD-like protein
MKILGIGGGTGLPVLLRGLREVVRKAAFSRPARVSISAIVCTSDNGGSSGRLRKDFGIPAVGDLRNCLAALATTSFELPDLFQHRFTDGDGLQGHSLGNLIVTALYQKHGSLGEAIQTAARLLRLGGRVLPSTEMPTTLCAQFEDGSVLRGESEISFAGKRIERVWLEPQSPPPFTGVLEAIAAADVIVFGPGSLYTSIIPNLLVGDVPKAIRSSKALKVFICNLATQRGETEGFTASDHLLALGRYLGRGVIDVCVMNTDPIRSHSGEGSSRTPLEPVVNDSYEVARMGIVPFQTGLVAKEEAKVRHDPKKLAHLIVSIGASALRRSDLLLGEGGLVA